MEQAEFRKNAADMIYLTTCAINNEKPKQERIEKLNLPELFEVCQKHILTACVAYALESAGIKDSAFSFRQKRRQSARIFSLILSAEQFSADLKRKRYGICR